MAKRLGIKQSAAITCIKPSGTVSQLCDTASGIHPRFSPYYVRTVRQDDKDPAHGLLATLLVQRAGHWQGGEHDGVPLLPKGARWCGLRRGRRRHGAVASVEAVPRRVVRHKPSITVYYTPDEFMHVAAWMWDNFDSLSGISLLPYDGGTYQQAPYQQITEEQYKAGVVPRLQ